MKNNIKIITVLIVGFILSYNIGYSQDFQLTQFYSAPTLMNPGFTGNVRGSRIVSNYRSQWSRVPGVFKTFGLSYDKHLSKINSGIGLRVLRDKAGSGGLGYTNIAAMYAYDVKLNYKMGFRPGITIGRTHRTIDYSKFTFGDQLNTGAATTIEPIEALNVSYMDIAFGGVLYSKSFWLGLSADHFNKPQSSYLGLGYRIDALYALQGGYKHRIKKLLRNKGYKSITYAFNYRKQGDFDQFDIGLYFENNPLMLGFWYRGLPMLKKYEDTEEINHDAIALLLGYTVRDVRIGYSYDVSINSLLAKSGGSHEISLMFEFYNPKRRGRRRANIIPCPRF